MMNVLRRELAPISNDAWTAIDDEARSALEANLTARRYVDVHGPLGWDISSVNLGRLDTIRENEGVRWGLRSVQPLLEARTPFTLSRWELDDLERGAPEVDLDPVRDAAIKLARFEDHVVLQGAADANIAGLINRSTYDPIAYDGHDGVAEAVANGMIRLSDSGVVGPYLLIFGRSQTTSIASANHGYPVRSQLTKLVGSAPLYSPALEGGLLVSTRGGDFSLTLGADFSIGFDHLEGDTIHCFITESFSFRVLGPEAVIQLVPKT